MDSNLLCLKIQRTQNYEVILKVSFKNDLERRTYILKEEVQIWMVGHKILYLKLGLKIC